MTATTGGGIAPARTGRHRLLLILLVVSAALNLCFVAGVVWSRMHIPPTSAERFHSIAAELDLSPQQQTAFNRYYQAMRTRTRAVHTEVDPIMAGAWGEIAKTQPDPAQIMRFFDDAAEKRREFQRDAIASTLEFLATLSPGQRTKFTTLVRERRALWLHR